VPTSLTFDEHLDALEGSGRHLLDTALLAGATARVPTCPAWDVRALLAHQAVVHRWATAHVTGADPSSLPNQTTVRTTVADVAGYYAEGLDALLAALRDAPPDLKAMTFLNDCPPPRGFWARRQAHETTVHGVDALAARLRRVPTSTEAPIDPPFASDGLDELLAGFFTRGRSKLYDGEELDVLVAPSDTSRAWLLHVGPSLEVEPVDGRRPRTPVVVRGTTVALYLALWNRGDEVEVVGRPDLLTRWRTSQRVRWS
jgi:uncharacterized protein (TIGR03083 family)